MALAYMGLKPGPGSGKLADSADPVWLDRESPPPAVATQHDNHASVAIGEVAISSLSALAATVDLMCMRLRHCYGKLADTVWLDHELPLPAAHSQPGVRTSAANGEVAIALPGSLQCPLAE